MPIGIIDIGSNTIRLAVYEVVAGKINLLLKKKHLVGLAAHIENSRLTPAGIDMAADAVSEYRKLLRLLGIGSDIAYATGALRNAANSQAAVAAIEKKSGVKIRILSGEEEATLAFVGLMHDVEVDTGLVVDIGGASTELIYFKQGKIEAKTSLPIGSLAMYKEYVGNYLPTAAECKTIENYAAVKIREANFVAPPCDRLCGIGGTFKSALALVNAYFKRSATNKLSSWEDIDALRRLYCMDGKHSAADMLLLMQAVPDRLKVLLPGLSVAAATVRAFGCREILYSDSGVREGYIRDTMRL